MQTIYYKSSNFLIYSRFTNGKRDVMLIDNDKLRNFSLQDQELDEILQKMSDMEKINTFANNEDRQEKLDAAIDYYIEQKLV